MKDRRNKNLYAYLALKLLLAFGALMLAQVAFYVANSHILRPSGSEWWGIAWGNVVFGLSTVATLLLPWLVLMLLPVEARWRRWYRAVCEGLYLLGVLLILIPRGCNGAYFQYTYRLLSGEIFSYLGISGQMGSLAPHFATDYWYAWAVPLAIFLLVLVLDSRLRLAPRSPYRSHLGNDLLGMVAGGALVWLMARGGFGPRLVPDSATRFAQPKLTALVSNDAYNILHTLCAPDLKEQRYMPDDEAAALYPTVHLPLLADTAAPRPNVVLIVVESLGQEFMGCYNHSDGADTRTPFLDSLARLCALYDGRANGKKSIEGITAINASIPNLMNRPFTNSVHDTDTYTGLPALLKRHGYRTAFFHGTYNGVMDFDRTCARIGFDEYLGKNEYEAEGLGRPEDYDGAWGILDEPFLQYTVRRLNTYAEPFFAEVFTVSSHHPYPMPDEYRERFREGRHPILKCVEYTDHALRRFFAEASRQPWFANTLFIITGDHSGHGLSPEYNDYDGWYRIPMMIYRPYDTAAPTGYDPTLVQQVDLYPTVADLLGLPDTFVTFGQSLLRHPGRGRQVYFGNGFHCMVSNSEADPAQHDITLLQGSYERGREEDLQVLKALVQQYNDRIINNNLIEP